MPNRDHKFVGLLKVVGLYVAAAFAPLSRNRSGENQRTPARGTVDNNSPEQVSFALLTSLISVGLRLSK